MLSSERDLGGMELPVFVERAGEHERGAVPHLVGQRVVEQHGQLGRALRVHEDEAVALSRRGKRAVLHRAGNLHGLVQNAVPVIRKLRHAERVAGILVL